MLDTSSIVARLTVAQDDSLIVAIMQNSRGIQFPAVPYHYESLTWFQFSRVH